MASRVCGNDKFLFIILEVGRRFIPLAAGQAGVCFLLSPAGPESVIEFYRDLTHSDSGAGYAWLLSY